MCCHLLLLASIRNWRHNSQLIQKHLIEYFRIPFRIVRILINKRDLIFLWLFKPLSDSKHRRIRVFHDSVNGVSLFIKIFSCLYNLVEVKVVMPILKDLKSVFFVK